MPRLYRRQLVLRQRIGTTAVQETDGDTCVTTFVGGSQPAREERCEIDVDAVDFARGEDAWYGNAYVGLRVVADRDGVDDEGQKRRLVFGGVLFEQGSCIVVAFAFYVSTDSLFTFSLITRSYVVNIRDEFTLRKID